MQAASRNPRIARDVLEEAKEVMASMNPSEDSEPRDQDLSQEEYESESDNPADPIPPLPVALATNLVHLEEEVKEETKEAVKD